MKRLFTAIAAILLAAVPARATTFPGLTLIYVASGVTDSGSSSANGHYATAVHCTNISGQTATVTRVFYTNAGIIVGTNSTPILHPQSLTISTQNTGFNEIVLDTGPIIQGFVSIYSTQSAVFCSAMIVDPTLIVPQGIDLHMVRFNAHPGTVE